jgi:CCR4-NOT transcription complex subunit 4
VTYVSGADALRAIQGVNNVTLDGRVLKGSLGTTKYCANFMKNQPCPKPDCMYLHDLGQYTKLTRHTWRPIGFCIRCSFI